MKVVCVTALCLFTILSGFVLSLPAEPWPYEQSAQIRAKFQQDSSGTNADKAAYAFSYIGDYQRALSYNDKNYVPRWTLKGIVKASDSLFLQHCRPVNAKDYIIRQAANERIVIINEAHHNPLHRVFTASLLADLYQAGFRYLGAETLNYQDSTLNQRQYPTLNSGYYMREPQYGNLIREALRMGFLVFAYEAITDEEFASGKSREIAQARHVEAILKQDPTAKIVLHCGYDHVVEVPMSNSWQKAMAGRLKEFTGIDPLTIDQQQWTELSQSGKGHPLYRPMKLSQPSIFVNAQGQAYPGLALGRTDLQVAHPRTRYRYGRPVWLSRDGQWKPYVVKRAANLPRLPCLVFALRADEGVDATKPGEQPVPVDIIELTSWQENRALILPPGKYRLIFQNSVGERQQMTLLHR